LLKIWKVICSCEITLQKKKNCGNKQHVGFCMKSICIQFLCIDMCCYSYELSTECLSKGATKWAQWGHDEKESYRASHINDYTRCRWAHGLIFYATISYNLNPWWSGATEMKTTRAKPTIKKVHFLDMVLSSHNSHCIICIQSMEEFICVHELYEQIGFFIKCLSMSEKQNQLTNSLTV